MTNIKCIKDRRSYQIDIEGHANYNDGIDLVCGAVSTLSYTLMCALDNNEIESKHFNYSEGDVHVNVTATKESEREIDKIIETIMIGFEMLADKYPDNVSLEW